MEDFRNCINSKKYSDEEKEEMKSDAENLVNKYVNMSKSELQYNLMQEVAKARNEEVTGVPYIIVGNKSWTGFVEDYKQEILDQINSVYSEDVNSRYDIIELLKTGESDKSSDAAALIIILLIAGGIGFGIYKARKSAK